MKGDINIWTVQAIKVLGTTIRCTVKANMLTAMVYLGTERILMDCLIREEHISLLDRRKGCRCVDITLKVTAM